MPREADGHTTCRSVGFAVVVVVVVDVAIVDVVDRGGWYIMDIY